VLATAVLLMAVPLAEAKGRPEPFDVRQATAVGRAAETNSLNGIYVSPYDGNVYASQPSHTSPSLASSAPKLRLISLESDASVTAPF
jgi:hypothetical protein